MVDGLYTYMKSNNETSCNCFKWDRDKCQGRENGGDLTNVQYKPIRNCHNEFPQYNEYILIFEKSEK
jgi:hypothetical protein